MPVSKAIRNDNRAEKTITPAISQTLQPTMSMKIIEEKRVEMDTEQAWKVLANNFAAPESYSTDFVVKSEMLPGPQSGVGASFRLYLKGGAYVEERVVEWIEGRSITTKTVATHKVPISGFSKTIGLLPILGGGKSYIYVHLDFEPKDFWNRVDAMLFVKTCYQKMIRKSLRTFEERHSTAIVPKSSTAPWKRNSGILQVVLA
mmetsp:Transcript_29496/g.71763  ORF Transcript_29496/g.71763 Transcript_29496/m.71763 type:complete len:203 (+) Transcript_29496:139-747(+)